MALKATPFALPVADLEKPDGSVTPSSALHAGGPTLVMIGHLNCKTSKQTLPFIAQIHKDGGRAVTMLQDSPENAAAGLAKLGLTLPYFCERDPYALSAAIGIVTVPTLLFIEADGTVALTSEAFRRPDIEAFAERLGAPKPVIANDTMPGFKPG
ncbi:MAG: hypothetical protein KBH14_05125 [Vicinamibacteria bacterium]|jgi:hypothetical protein|nr:hypothetical protein [Vicinamibacteria bacterium]